MKQYYYYIEQAMKGELDKAYDYTMPLIVTSLQISNFRYEFNLIKHKTMQAILKERSDQGHIDGKIAWLLGRVLYANKMSNLESPMDFLTIDPAKTYLNTRSVPFNNYEAWAIGYYSILKPFYEDKKQSFVGIANSCSNLSDRLWAYNLYLSVSAQHNDVEVYKLLRESLMKNAGVTSLHEAIKEIPGDDFRGWGLGLALISEAKMGVESRVLEIYAQEIEEVKKKKVNVHDCALAESYLVYYNNNLGTLKAH
jgi:hypothetical protein